VRECVFWELTTALRFVTERGGPVEEIVGPIPGYQRAHGAYGYGDAFVRLADGSYFGVVAYTKGSLSEVTPEDDFGVRIVGLVAP